MVTGVPRSPRGTCPLQAAFPTGVGAEAGKPEEGVVARVGRSRRERAQLLSELGPHSRAAEAYRQLRSNLRFASVDAPLRSVTVTSALAGEGRA